MGTKSQIIEIIEAYIAVGINQINLTFRQHIDSEALEYFIEEIIPIYAK